MMPPVLLFPGRFKVMGQMVRKAFGRRRLRVRGNGFLGLSLNSQTTIVISL